MNRWNNRSGEGKAYAFLMEHASDEDGECLIFPFFRDPDSGYGRLSHHGDLLYAHREMCKLVNGPPPSDIHEASHSCGCGHDGCIHPKHLSWKTPSENQLDRSGHGTATTNEFGSRGKLTYEQMAEIAALKGTEPQRVTAKRYGVHFETISRLQRKPLPVRKIRRPFTPAEVIEIRTIGYSMSLADLATRFDTNAAAVHRIRIGQTYKDIM